MGKCLGNKCTLSTAQHHSDVGHLKHYEVLQMCLEPAGSERGLISNIRTITSSVQGTAAASLSDVNGSTVTCKATMQV